MRKLPARPPIGLNGSLLQTNRAIGPSSVRHRALSTSTTLRQDDKSQPSSSAASRAPEGTTPRRFRAANAASRVQRLGGIVKAAGGGFGNVATDRGGSSPPAGARMARRIVPTASAAEGKTMARRVTPAEGKTQVRRVIQAKDGPQPAARRPAFARRAAPGTSHRPSAGGPRIPGRRAAGPPRRPGVNRGPRPPRRRRETSDANRRLTPTEEREQMKLFWHKYEAAKAAPYVPKNADGTPSNEGITYVPDASSLTREDLITNRIATMLGGGATQMSEVLGRLARRDDTRWVLDAPLARKLCNGQLVRFKDAEEKERIVALAEKFAESTAAKISKQKKKVVLKQDVGFEAVGGKERKKLVEKVLRGSYELHRLSADEKKPQREQAVGAVEAALQLNGTWTPAKSREFLQKFESMWPAAQQQAAARK